MFPSSSGWAENHWFSANRAGLEKPDFEVLLSLTPSCVPNKVGNSSMLGLKGLLGSSETPAPPGPHPHSTLEEMGCV